MGFVTITLLADDDAQMFIYVNINHIVWYGLDEDGDNCIQLSSHEPAQRYRIKETAGEITQAINAQRGM